MITLAPAIPSQTTPRCAPESRSAPKPDEVARETQVIPHGGIRWRVEAVPRQQVWPARIDVPGLLLEKFLAHENLGNAGGGQENGGRDAAAASRVPGAVIGRVGQRRQPRVAACQDEVMVLETGDGAPGVVERGRIKRR